MTAYAIGLIGEHKVKIGPNFANDPLKWQAMGTERSVERVVA